MSNIWQLGGGAGRNVTEYYKAMGVACIGPGVEVTKENWDNILYESGSRGASALWAFKFSTKPGDIILVKSGRWSISLVGIIKSKDNNKNEVDYQLLAGQEGIVDGWDLQHQIKVDWFEVKTNSVDIVNKEFLRQEYSLPVVRFSNCINGITDKIKKMVSKNDIDMRSYLETSTNLFEFIKPNPEKYKYKILKYDLPADFALTPEETRLKNSILAVCDNETFRKIFFVVPFLRNLGWLPELMEFEKQAKGAADIILYEDFSHKIPFAVVETKRAWAALGSWALDQAEHYAKNIDGDPKILCVTDGIRYIISTYESQIDIGDGSETGKKQQTIIEIDREKGKMSDPYGLNYLHPSTFSN